MPPRLQDLAYESILKRILSRQLRPDHLYSEARLAVELEMSRSPIRAALERLDKEGLVVKCPQRGFHVYQFGGKDIEELFGIRKAIEGFAVEYVTTTKEKLKLDKLERRLENQKKAVEIPDFRAFMREDAGFHGQLVRATGNKRLLALFLDLRQLIEVVGLYVIVDTGSCRRLIREHEQVLEAVKRKDAPRAKQILYAHFDLAAQIFRKHLDQSHPSNGFLSSVHSLRGELNNPGYTE